MVFNIELFNINFIYNDFLKDQLKASLNKKPLHNLAQVINADIVFSLLLMKLF